MRAQKELKRKQKAEELVEKKRKDEEERQAHIDAIKNQEVAQPSTLEEMSREVEGGVARQQPTSDSSGTPAAIASTLEEASKESNREDENKRGEKQRKVTSVPAEVPEVPREKPTKRAVTISISSLTDSSAKSQAAPKSKSIPPTGKKWTRPRPVKFERSQISSYVYPYDRTRPSGEHEVFALIQEHETREKGRHIILLHSKASSLQEELTTLEYQRGGGKAKAEKDLLKEQNLLTELSEKRSRIAGIYRNRKMENNTKLVEQNEKTQGRRNEIESGFRERTRVLQEEIRNSECALRDAPQRIRDNDKLVKEIEAEISSLETKIVEKDSEANAISEEMTLLETSEAKEREAKLSSLDQQIADTKKQISERRRELDQLKRDESSDKDKIESVEEEIEDMDATIDRLKEQKKVVKKGGEQQKGLWNKLTSSLWGDAESQQKVLGEKLTKRRDEWVKLKKDLDLKKKALTEEKDFPSNWPSNRDMIENALPGMRAKLASLGEKELQELKTLEDEDDKWNADHEEKCERLDATTNDAIESVTKQIEDKEAQIKEMERALSMDSKSLYELVSRKRAEVDDVLHELSDLQEEKVDLGKFDIDRLHDRRGLTLLSVAALNEDVKTVRVCLEVGASPSVLNADNTRAIDIAYRFGFDEISDMLGTSHLQTNSWKYLEEVAPIDPDLRKDWEDTYEVAKAAAVPAEALRESPEKCEADEEKRMHFLEPHNTIDFSCFENRLVEGTFNSSTTRRTVLLNKDVYNWCKTVNPAARSNFINTLEGLKPPEIRRPHVPATPIRRRSIVGTIITFELLAAPFKAEYAKEMVALLTPFVSGSVDGYKSIGILVWAVVKDEEASMYRTLISNVEFLRNKVALEDDFPPHRPGVLELGVDMHLLDLTSTSIWTTSAMELRILNVDEGDLDNLQAKGFDARRRIVLSDLLTNRKIFNKDDAEEEDQAQVLNRCRVNMSYHVIGGAGTGKTWLLIKKVAAERPDKKILVVTRLSRLIKMIKTKVEETRKEGLENVIYYQYDELMQLLSRQITPQDGDYRSFGQFEQVKFDSGSLSFEGNFMQDCLNDRERKNMKKLSIEPLSLWGSIITIKSHSSVVETKAPLTLEAYLRLASSFGLTREQRIICYSLFEIYEKWRMKHKAWDEMDRTIYCLKHGPPSLSEYPYVSWVDRSNKYGEATVEDFPFFVEEVCVDEYQDFTESDTALFAGLSGGVTNLYFSADAAQSVELGIKLRKTQVNEVMYRMLTDGTRGKVKRVKDVVDIISLGTNHRTTKPNLDVATAFRKILARSFQVANPKEEALINGDLPEMLSIKFLDELALGKRFRGANVVFVVPDELVGTLRSRFNLLRLSNDVFGVREAKGLEFDSVALLGFLSTFENSGCVEEWQNVLRWLSSDKKITVTTSKEKIGGKFLMDCDYTLTCPKLSDQCMLLYTAITRARNKLYFIEIDELSSSSKRAGVLSDFVYRRLEELKLAKYVAEIDTGKVEITPAEHKASGVAYVVQAVGLSREDKPLSAIKVKLNEAIAKFAPERANDSELLEKAKKHLMCVKERAELFGYVRRELKGGAGYELRSKFGKVMEFEKLTGEFMRRYLGDSFLVEEVERVIRLVEEVLSGSPYEIRMNDYMAKIRTISSL